jgi:hypothetical protein
MPFALTVSPRSGGYPTSPREDRLARTRRAQRGNPGRFAQTRHKGTRDPACHSRKGLIRGDRDSGWVVVSSHGIRGTIGEQ